MTDLEGQQHLERSKEIQSQTSIRLSRLSLSRAFTLARGRLLPFLSKQASDRGGPLGQFLPLPMHDGQSWMRYGRWKTEESSIVGCQTARLGDLAEPGLSDFHWTLRPDEMLG